MQYAKNKEDALCVCVCVCVCVGGNVDVFRFNFSYKPKSALKKSIEMRKKIDSK
jgi:hypothetical protein